MKVSLIIFSVFIAHSCAQLSQEWRHRPKRPNVAVPLAQNKNGCGWSNSDGAGFNVSDNKQAKFGEFPWTVAVFRKDYVLDDAVSLYNCGGSLVATKAVLTAAHCVTDPQGHGLIVRAGEWDSQDTNEILKHVDRDVREVITHENYRKDVLFNDVALLILKDPFVWQDHIRPICLPKTNINFDHSRCYVSGWGKDTIGSRGQFNKIMTKIDLPVVPRATCQNNLRQTRLGKYFSLHQSFLCAGGEANKDTCQGYGGSPLVCPIDGFKDRYYQAGIVAWGIGCGTEGVPGVYVNIPFLSSWISRKLTSKGIDHAHYTP